MSEETKVQRDVLKFTPEQMEDVFDNEGWKDITKSHFDSRRWCDVWEFIVQNEATGKFYAYYDDVYSGDGEGDSPAEYELTEVFLHTVSTVVYK